MTAPVPLVPVGATSRDYDNPLATCPLEDRWPWCAAPVRVAVARPREPLRLAASAPAATSCQGRLATAALRARALDIRYLFLVPQSGFLTLATRWTLATWSGCQAQHRRRRRLTLYFHSHRQGTQGTLALAPNVLARCFGVCMLRGADAGGEYVVLREIVKGFCGGLFQVLLRLVLGNSRQRLVPGTPSVVVPSPSAGSSAISDAVLRARYITAVRALVEQKQDRNLALKLREPSRPPEPLVRPRTLVLRDLSGSPVLT